MNEGEVPEKCHICEEEYSLEMVRRFFSWLCPPLPVHPNRISTIVGSV